MGTEIILASVGALLVLTAGIGGGFEVKSAKIPKVGVAGRVVSLVLGVVCLGLAIMMSLGDDELTEEEMLEDEEALIEDEEEALADEGQVSQDTPPQPQPPKKRPPPPPKGPPPPPF